LALPARHVPPWIAKNNSCGISLFPLFTSFTTGSFYTAVIYAGPANRIVKCVALFPFAATSDNRKKTNLLPEKAVKTRDGKKRVVFL